MSRHVFASAVLLLVLVMMFCGTGGAASSQDTSSDPQFKWRGITDGETVESLGAPSLLKVGSDVFAVAEAQCKKDGVSFTGVASQPLKTATADPSEEVLEKPEGETQVLEENASDDAKKKLDVSRPTTAVKGNDIYMLVGQYGSKDCQNSDAGGCELLLVKGSVSSGEDANKKIEWKVTETPLKSVDAQPDSWTRLIGSGGSGVKMKDETLVFPVEGTKKAEGDAEVDVKTVSLIIHSKDNTNWNLSKGMSADGCSDPSVVEWEEDKLMMMTACDDGRRRVYESGDKGNTWTEALGTLSRVWGNKHKENEKAVGSGLTTAKIDNRDVLLVTLPVYSKKEKNGNNNGKSVLHLWLTDNTHIVDIGPVSGDEDVAASSLLYNSGESTDELIALYEKKKKDEEKPSPGMVSVLLTEKLKRMKEVLTTWKEVDERVSQLCTSLIAEKDRSTDTACGADKITAGLVGFLSGNFSGNVWRDEYLGVNATVNNKGAAAATVTSTDKGVTFTGRGAGAEWPVGEQGENQLYHFANYNFTLVATVSIDGEPTKEGNIPLVGVRVGSNGKKTKLMELSYGSENKWHVLCSDGNSKEVSSTWETDKTYQVAIMLQNGTQGSVYVDGQRVGGNGECELVNGESKEISHFYIGGDGESADNKESVSVTVRNVLLYNRPLDEAEITALNPNKALTPSPVDGPSQGTGTLSTLDGNQLTGQGQSMGSSKGAGSGGASPSAVPTVSTLSAGKDTLQQVTSGRSSDGHKNVGGGSFSDGEPTVETAGGTDGQKEEVNTQVGEVKAAALSNSLGNVSQGNDSDAGNMHGSGLLPLLLLLLGLWGLRLCEA